MVFQLFFAVEFCSEEGFLLVFAFLEKNGNCLEQFLPALSISI
jgi:hypothetical protein